MSLLDKASLIVTPNAYEESKLYSVIPNTTLGDMDVVRATTATRVNNAGLIEVVPRNLFGYSNDFTNANWTKQNSSITTSQIGYDGTNNASLLVENSTTNTHFTRQTPPAAGQTTISVYAKANTRNWLYLRGVQSGVPVNGWFNLSNGTLGTIQTNGTGSITSVGNGWYRCSLTIANFNTGFEVYIGLSNADNVTSYLGNGSSIFIQNAQFENFATATEYFPTTTRLNIPRIDYTNGSCPSILVEPQRTNLVFPSATLTTQIRTVTAASNTLSFYGTGTIVLSGVHIATLTGTGANNRVSLTFTPTAGSLILTVTGTVTNAQLELGSYATSYIPSVASTVTRNADVISKTGISSLIGTEFTLFLDAYETTGGNSSRYIVLKGTGGTYANAVLLESNSSNRIILTVLNSSSATVFGSFSGILTNGQRFKLAVRCKNNDFAFYVNGVLVGSQASGTVPTTSDLYLGYYTDYSDNYNKINSATIFNTALTNTELAQLTTL